MPLELTSVIQHTRAKREGREYRGHCPAHPDSTPSLTFRQGDNGKLIFKCWSGCSGEKILKALGHTPNGRDPMLRNDPNAARFVCAYEYKDLSGAVLFQNRRYEPGQNGKKKGFRPWHPDGRGGWRKGLPPHIPRIPLGWAALRSAITAGKGVCITGGEKDAQALQAIGVAATTFVGGAYGTLPDDWPTYFAGAGQVVLLPHNDDPGRARMARLGRGLIGVAKSVRVLALPDVPADGGDVYDWLSSGGDRSQLNALIAAAPEYVPAAGDDDAHDDLHNEPESGGRKDPPGPMWLRELLERPELLEPPTARIPRFAYDGRVTLFVAREKAGKSTLLSQAGAALTRGGELLGDTLTATTVLWYCIDEPLGDAVRRFADLGADPDRLALLDVPPTPDELRAHIEATGAGVVVLDTLRQLLDLGHIKENDADETSAFLRPYITVVRTADVGFVLLHHANRSSGEYRGSGHLGAAVDIIVTTRPLTKPEDQTGAEQDDPRRVLSGKGRGISFHDRLTFDGRRYCLGGGPLPLRQRILDYLLDEPASASKTAEDLEVRKGTVTAEYRSLVRDGLVRQTGKRYDLTDSGRLAAVGAVSVPDRLTSADLGNRYTEWSESPVPEENGDGTGREPEGNRGGTDTAPGLAMSAPSAGLSVPEKMPRGFSREPVADGAADSVIAFTI